GTISSGVMRSPLTVTRSSNGRLRLSTCFSRSSFAGPGSARRTMAGGVRPDTLPGILPPNASRLGQRRSRRGDPRSPKVTPERFCVLQHGSRVDGLPEVDDGIFTSVVIVVPEARRASRPASLRGLARLLCSRPGFEQLAPYIAERPTGEEGSREQDESGNDGHRDTYGREPRDEAGACAPNITHCHLRPPETRELSSSRRLARARPLGTAPRDVTNP